MILFLLEISEPIIVKLIDSPWDIVISIISIVVAACSIIISLIFGLSQRRHNRNSVRPIAEIRTGNYYGHIFVNLENRGTGPLIIKKLICRNATEEKTNLIDFMNDLPISFVTYKSGVLNGSTIAINKEFVLIELKYTNFNKCEADEVKRRLSDITIEVEYTDIYGTKFDKCIKKLSTFK